MPGSGKHNVGNIDSFFKVRPSRLNVREGEVISFLEDGNLVKQEKRNGVIYQSVFVEQGKKEKEATTQNQTSSTAISGAISSVSAGTGLSGGGTSGAVTLNVSGVLEDFNTLGAPASDGQFIVATGSGAFAYESGTTVRTSLGLGTLATLSSISDSQVASDASIAITKLAASSITVADGSSSTAISLGNTITFSGTSNEVTVGESSGTITVGLPDDVVIANSLVVNGTTTTIDTQNLIVEDPLIKLAKANNAADSVDIGFYGLYDTSGTDKYAGLFRDANDSGKFKLFKDLQDEPTTTVDVSGTGYAKATLVADLEGNVTGNASGNAGTATALATGRDISLTGDVTGTTNTVFDGTGNVSIAASIANDSVDLGTHTTGNYVATLTAGNLIDLQNNSGEGATPTIDVDLSELSTSTSDGDGDFFAVVDSSNAQKKLTKGNINLSGFNNDSGFTSNAGTVTSITVTGGDGLTGGGSAITSSGSVTLAVGSSSLAVSSNAVDIAYSALSAISDDIATSDHIIFFDASNSNAVQIGTVSDLPFTNTSGTVTNVVAGAGLTGGGTTSATLDVGAGTGISVATNSVSTNDSEIVHDNLSGFVANEHIDHSGVSITAGNGLTGGGTIASTRTLAVGAGDGIAVNANDVEVDFSGLSILNTDSEPLTSQDTVVVYNQSADAIVQLSVDDIGGGTITSATNMSNNRILTASGSTTINGEANFTIDGTSLQLGDSKILSLGNSDDLQIHHTPNHNYIDINNGNLYFRDDADNNIFIVYREGGGIQLSEGDLKIPATSKLYLDGGSGTYVHELSDNVIEFRTDNNPQLKIDNSAGVIVNDGSYSSFDFRVESNNNTHMLFVDSGNDKVGLGTSSPDTTLDITSAGANGMVINTDTNDTSNSGRIFFRNSSGSYSMYKVGGYLRVNSGATAGSSSGGTNLISIGSNVGIGTTTPSEKLEVSGKILATGGQVRAGSYLEGFPSFSFANDTDTGMFSDTANQLEFSTGGSSRLTIDSSGNVGIGTSSPAQKLHIEGNICRLDKVGTDGGYYLYDSSNNFRFALFDNNSQTQLYADGNGSTAVMTFDSGDVSVTGKLQLPASHSADKIVMYSGGNEKIGTEANTLLFTAANHVFHNTSNADMMKITASGVFVDDISGLSNGTNKLVLDDDTNSATANGVSLTGVNHIYICPDETNNGVGEVRIIKGTDNDLDSGTAAELARFDNSGNLDFTRLSSTQTRYVHLPRAGGITFYGDRSTHHGIFSRDDSNSSADDLLISSYGAVYIDLDSNNNNTSNAHFEIGKHNTANDPIFMVDGETGHVGINENSLDADLHITGSPVVLKLERPGQRAMRMGTPDNSSLFIFADSDDLKSNQRMVIDNSGQVGIGTTSPDANLVVASSSGATIKLQDTGSHAFSLVCENNSNFLNFKEGSGTSILSIDGNNQRLGIGHTSPQKHLDITKTGTATFMMKGTGTDNYAGSQLSLFAGTTSNVFNSVMFAMDRRTDGVGGIYLQRRDSSHDFKGTLFQYLDVSGWTFSTASSTTATSTNERMIIDPSGDVKINESLGIGVAASSTTGRLDCSNDVVAFASSDKRLKENIKPLDNALDKINKINGVEFDWKKLTEKEKETIHGNTGHDVGVIAQEIEEVLPEVVTTRDNGYKAVKYEKIVPLLIQAIKEQQQQIEELKNG